MTVQFADIVIHFTPMPSRADADTKQEIMQGQARMVEGSMNVSGEATLEQVSTFHSGLQNEVVGSSDWLTYLGTWVTLD